MPENQLLTLEAFGKLTKAEEMVLSNLDTGRPIILSEQQDEDGNAIPPEQSDRREEIFLRASFLRWIALTDGRAFRDKTGNAGRAYRVDERGLQIEGAVVGCRELEEDWPLDLEGVQITRKLHLSRCRFDVGLDLMDAEVGGCISTAQCCRG